MTHGAILGPGPIGILCGIFAKMAGADTAIKGLVSDSSRLEVAQKSYGLKALTEGADVWARDLDGLGADVVVDAAGVSESLKMAIDLVRPNGTIVKVGWGPKPIDFSLDPVVQKNVKFCRTRSVHTHTHSGSSIAAAPIAHNFSHLLWLLGQLPS